MRIGIICPSEIALRRFLPALKNTTAFSYIGVAYATITEWYGATEDTIRNEKEKAASFQNEFGGEVFYGYQNLIESDKVDAIYLPLPPALHYEWAKKALLAGKHVLVEKPASISSIHTKELIEIAKKTNVALHENYMFGFHQQLNDINTMLQNGIIGNIRQYFVNFGFPLRALSDFRYNKKLGGGALLDCGGYTIRYASMLLGNSAKIKYAHLGYINGFEVDMYGSGVLENDEGTTVHISFGMDNEYKCDLEVWGNKGLLTTNRILTAPVGYTPEATIKRGNNIEVISLTADDTFKKSIEYFRECIHNNTLREESFSKILKQSEYIDIFNSLAVK